MNILIIGAGGVTSYLLPLLKSSFDTSYPNGVMIMDKDTLEERNLERQQFNPDLVGLGKAEGLAKMYKMGYQNAWFESQLVDEFDIVICCADNHTARRNVLTQCDIGLTPCIIGGNEYFDSEAYFYHPMWKGEDRDPRVRYPELLTDTNFNPIRCNDEEALESTPQLAIANATCATHIAHLLWNHVHSKANLDMLPYQFLTTQYGVEKL
jgi:molybdopterin/thiamine biosynthesis adenylyltransferase